MEHMADILMDFIHIPLIHFRSFICSSSSFVFAPLKFRGSPLPTIHVQVLFPSNFYPDVLLSLLVTDYKQLYHNMTLNFSSMQKSLWRYSAEKNRAGLQDWQKSESGMGHKVTYKNNVFRLWVFLSVYVVLEGKDCSYSPKRSINLHQCLPSHIDQLRNISFYSTGSNFCPNIKVQVY